MALNLVANLTLRTRGFMQGIATSQNAAAKFARFLGSNAAAGATAQAGGFAAQSLLSRVFGGAKTVANEIPGVPTIKAAADTVQPIVDPLGLKRKMALALAGAGAAGAFVAKKGIEQIAEVKDLAEQMDETVETVQRLTAAAKDAGLEIGNFQTALSFGMNVRQEAVESSRELRDKFAALGVTMEDLQNPGKSTLDLMRQVVRTANDVRSDSFRAAFRDLFGKGSERLIPAVQNLDKNLGLVVSTRAADAVDKLAKGFDRLGRSIRNAFGEATGQVLAAFQDKLEGPGILGALNKVLGKMVDAGVTVAKTGVSVATGGLIDLREKELPPKPGDFDFVGPLPDAGKLFRQELEFKEAQEEAEKVRRLNEQIHQEQLRGMNAEQRRIALQRDLAAVAMEIDHLTFDTKESERKELELKKAQLETDLAVLDKRGAPFEVTADSLAKVGTFATAGDGAIRSLWEQIARATKETAENTRGAEGDIF